MNILPVSDPKTYFQRCDSDSVHESFLTINEVSKIFKISKSSLYELIERRSKTGFPVMNVGTKKKYVIPVKELMIWLQQRNMKTTKIIPTGEDLLRKFKR